MTFTAGPSADAASLLTVCVHCGTSFRAGSSGERFCCHGCETVHQLLTTAGLDDYYRLREISPPVCALPAKVSSESFAFCDDPEVIRKYSRNEREMDFFVEGLNCSACIWLLERLPLLCGDVESVEVNFAKSTVRVKRVDGGSFARAAQALNRIGYTPHLVDESGSQELLRKRERRRELIRIGVAAACTGNIMIFSVSLYGGADAFIGQWFAWLTAVLAAPVLTYGAWPFYRSAYQALRARTLNLDVPIVAALIAGVVMSAWSLTLGEGAVYFDSLSMLVFLLLSSRAWLKNLQQTHLDASRLEDSLLLGTVERLAADGRTREKVSRLSLQVDDFVMIAPDTLIPADGVIAHGHGLVQMSALTGESAPVDVREGDVVFAGTQNVDGEWVLQVKKKVADSRLARLLRDAEISSREKPALIRFADQVGRWFVGVVFVLALLVVARFALTNPSEGFARALALVIVTCPCVFGMAIPLSLSLAVKAAARRGLLIKNGDVIERLAAIRKVYFDKTGTVTEAALSCVGFQICTGDLSEFGVLRALEKDQEHPVAVALLRAIEALDLPEMKVSNVRVEDGRLIGECGGIEYSVRAHGLSDAETLRMSYGFYRENEMLARFDLGDRVREDAAEALRSLRARGLETVLLSGDRRSVVETVGRRLGFTLVNAEATPEHKRELLRADGERAAMIGDGANDASALAAASVGIAVRGSMEASLRAADVYLLKNDLRAIDDLFSIARATRRAIVRNLLISVSFNICAGTLALTGHMHPLWAAVLMPLSSLTVLISSLVTGRRLETGK